MIVKSDKLYFIDFLVFLYLFLLSLLIVRPEYYLINYFSVIISVLSIPFLLKLSTFGKSLFLFSYILQLLWLFFGLFFIRYVDNASIALLSHSKNVITAIIPALFVNNIKKLKISLYLVVIAGLVNLFNNVIGGAGALTTGERFLMEEEQLSLNNFAHNSFLYIISAIFLIFIENKKSLKLMLLLYVVLGCTSLMITGSRQSFVALMGFFVYYFSIKIIQFKPKYLILLFLSVVLGYLVFEWLINAFPNSPLVRRFSEGTNEGDDQRLDFIITAWNLFLESPIVGYGMDTFRYFSSFVYTHSTYSEIIFNGGLIYVILFGLFYFKSFKKINLLDNQRFSFDDSLLIKSFIFSILVYGLFFLVHTSRLSLTLQFLLINYALTNNKFDYKSNAS